MSKFKIGDKVRVIKDKNQHNLPNKDFDRFLEKNKNILTIAYVSTTSSIYYEVEEDRNWCLEEFELELLTNTKPTKQELLDMPVGTKIYTDAEDEDYQEYVKKFNENFDGKETVVLKEEINNDLTIADSRCGTKIIKIEKPTYETVYDYSTEVQEMTVAEIEKALGHAVKIIKEDK